MRHQTRRGVVAVGLLLGLALGPVTASAFHDAAPTEPGWSVDEQGRVVDEQGRVVIISGKSPTGATGFNPLFHPGYVVMHVGETVVIRVEGGSHDSGIEDPYLPAGAPPFKSTNFENPDARDPTGYEFQYRFTVPGTYNYYCTHSTQEWSNVAGYDPNNGNVVHPDTGSIRHVGRIVVLGEAAEEPPDATPPPSPTPSPVSTPVPPTQVQGALATPSPTPTPPVGVQATTAPTASTSDAGRRPSRSVAASDPAIADTGEAVGAPTLGVRFPAEPVAQAIPQTPDPTERTGVWWLGLAAFLAGLGVVLTKRLTARAASARSSNRSSSQ